MYESELKFNLCYDTEQHTQCPINLCKANTKISLFFPSCSALTLWYFSDDIITLQKNVWHCRHG